MARGNGQWLRHGTGRRSSAAVRDGTHSYALIHEPTSPLWRVVFRRTGRRIWLSLAPWQPRLGHRSGQDSV